MAKANCACQPKHGIMCTELRRLGKAVNHTHDEMVTAHQKRDMDYTQANSENAERTWQAYCNALDELEAHFDQSHFNQKGETHE